MIGDLMVSMEKGALQAVKSCVHLRPGEKVVIISDRESFSIAEALRRASEAEGAGDVEIFMMEEFGERPVDGYGSLAFSNVISDSLKKADVSFYAAAKKKGELQSFRWPMLSCARTNPKLRHAHMPGITEEIMGMGMAIDYEKIRALSARVYEIVKNARTIKVTTPAGTDLTAHFNPAYRWLVFDGNIEPGGWKNLPDGEVLTCVDRVEDGSVIVVDGILGDHFDLDYGLLSETPVRIELKDSRVDKLDCLNKDLLRDFEAYLVMDKNANHLGEFAIGTGIGLDRLIGNILQDEKFPGIHVAFGHGYPHETGSNLHSKAHVDAILLKPDILVDGEEIMRNGQFLIDY